jgi:diadenosine tetraphosphate (Ap4A) HIT family hydrolase
MSAMDCFACDRIAQIRRGENPHFIAELAESYVVLADEQAYNGWCILLLKDHHEHLASLSLRRQSRLWEDVAKVAAAMTRELEPARINYECLGNELHHIHWHVIPRYANDPAPQEPVWMRSRDERHVILTPDHEAALVAKLRRALQEA